MPQMMPMSWVMIMSMTLMIWFTALAVMFWISPANSISLQTNYNPPKKSVNFF
uniref:ATP synthase F0 subunit 8 n=1 Tax=Tinaminyssus melloi TaxID=105222 RepID=A0A5Q0RZ27_9ACAR|nr:ATP synthase F0 subunit 8 [Tinaminyssus melloi]QGA47508.1 ATP synthase F0 subunit 8 [Tinaminyssus melloi]